MIKYNENANHESMIRYISLSDFEGRLWSMQLLEINMNIFISFY